MSHNYSVGDWDDWLWVGTARSVGASPAVLSAMNGTVVYNWEFTNGKELFFNTEELTHAYKEGTDLTPHIHWCPSTSGPYTGTWTLSYLLYPSVATGTALGAIQTTTVAFNGTMTAYQMQTQDFGAVITGTNVKVSAILHAKLTLTLSIGTSCFLNSIGAHHQKNSIGSSGITTK